MLGCPEESMGLCPPLMQDYSEPRSDPLSRTMRSTHLFQTFLSVLSPVATSSSMFPIYVCLHHLRIHNPPNRPPTLLLPLRPSSFLRIYILTPHPVSSPHLLALQSPLGSNSFCIDKIVFAYGSLFCKSILLYL
jgi:hypothetical protein